MTANQNRPTYPKRQSRGVRHLVLVNGNKTLLLAAMCQARLATATVVAVIVAVALGHLKV